MKNFKMFDEIVKNWIYALMSGEYFQAEGNLYTSTEDDLKDPDEYKMGHCCLGVLARTCNVENKFLLDIGMLDEVGSVSLPEKLKLFREQFLLANVISTIIFPIEKEVSVEKLLAALNDEGYSFSKIADIIEKLYADFKEGKVLSYDE